RCAPDSPSHAWQTAVLLPARIPIAGALPPQAFPRANAPGRPEPFGSQCFALQYWKANESSLLVDKGKGRKKSRPPGRAGGCEKLRPSVPAAALAEHRQHPKTAMCRALRAALPNVAWRSNLATRPDERRRP